MNRLRGLVNERRQLSQTRRQNFRQNTAAFHLATYHIPPEKSKVFGIGVSHIRCSHLQPTGSPQHFLPKHCSPV